MLKLRVLACLMSTMCAGHSYAGTPYTEQPAPSFDQVLNGFTDSAADTVRINVLRELGETIGFRSGLVWEAQNIAKGLKAKETQLDRIFQFGTLVTTEHTLPPVIVEATDVATIAPDQLRTANKVFNIIKSEEFVSVPPTWRDYLFTGLTQAPEIVYPNEDAKPKTNTEKKAWEMAMKKGWDDGVQQAVNILDENFNRLNRDYNGMYRFSIMLKNGMITRTQIATQSYKVSPDSSKDSLTLDETHQQIMKKSEFQIDPQKWNALKQSQSGSRPTNEFTYGGR